MITPFNVLRHVNQFEMAPRDPVSVAVAEYAAGFFAVGSTSASVAYYTAYAISTIAVSVVTSSVLAALSPERDLGSLANSGALLSNRKNALEPMEFVYGEVRKGGTITYLESTGDNNKILHQIIVLAGHECEGIGDIYFNDLKVNMIDEDVVTYPYDGFAKIYKMSGSQTSQNDAFDNSTDSLASTLGADNVNIEGGVRFNFIGKGITYLYCRFTYDQDAWAEGLPTITAQVFGKKVQKTVNGALQPAAYSNNSAWCVRDFIASEYGLNDSSIDYATFEAAAVVCDDQSVISDGSKQYQMNGVIKANQPIGKVLGQMMTTCGGTLFWGAGKWRLTAGQFVTPTKTLDLGDFRSGIALGTKVSMRDNFNSVGGTFIDGSNRYISADYPQVTSAAFLSDDNGFASTLDLVLPYTTNSLIAQRLAKQTLYRAREQLTMSADFGMNAFDVEVGDYIKVKNDRYGWGDGKVFEVIGWRLNPNADEGDLRVALTLRESSEAAFGFTASDEQTIISNNTNLLKYYEVPSIGITISQEYRVVNENVVNVLVATVVSSAIERVDSIILKYKKTSDTNFTSVGQTILLNEGNNAGRFEIVGIDAPQISEGAVNYTVVATPVNAFGFKGLPVTATYNLTPDTTPPLAPASLDHALSGGTLFFSWPSVTALDLSHYKVYYNSSTTSSYTDSSTTLVISKIARPATSITYPAVSGRFFITAVDKTGNESTTVSATTVAATELPALGTTDTLDEGAGVFTNGAAYNLTYGTNFIQIGDYNDATDFGRYFVGTVSSGERIAFDVGTSRTLRSSATFGYVRNDFYEGGGGGTDTPVPPAGEINWDRIPFNWDTWPLNWDDWDQGSTNHGDVSISLFGRASDTIGGLSNETYGPWGGQLVGRYVQVYVQLDTETAFVTPRLVNLTISLEY